MDARQDQFAGLDNWLNNDQWPQPEQLLDAALEDEDRELANRLEAWKYY